MKALHILVFVGALGMMLSSGPAGAWGPQGHAAIGQAAVARLSPGARETVEAILGADSPAALGAAVADACFWPDTVREDPQWAWSAPLHYVNLPRDSEGYERDRDCFDGHCVTEAIPRYAGELRNSTLAGDRQRAWQSFAWLCHLVADLHQPLHAGIAEDRGGNEIEVVYRGERLNLHRFWDGALVEQRLAAGEPWQPAGGTADPSSAPPAWGRSLAIRWTEESHALALAAAYPPEPVISEAFAEASWALVRDQWSKASRRLALVLEAVLGRPAGGLGRLPGIAQRSRATRNPMRASWRSGNADMRNAEREWSGELAQ